MLHWQLIECVTAQGDVGHANVWKLEKRTVALYTLRTTKISLMSYIYNNNNKVKKVKLSP
jgi:hypothetical protein